MDGTSNIILPCDLYARRATASAPIVLDARPSDAFNTDDRVIVGMIPTLAACCAAGVVLYLRGVTA